MEVHVVELAEGHEISWKFCRSPLASVAEVVNVDALRVLAYRAAWIGQEMILPHLLPVRSRLAARGSNDPNTP